MFERQHSVFDRNSELRMKIGKGGKERKDLTDVEDMKGIPSKERRRIKKRTHHRYDNAKLDQQKHKERNADSELERNRSGSNKKSRASALLADDARNHRPSLLLFPQSLGK